jgi:hypothetical protein
MSVRFAALALLMASPAVFGDDMRDREKLNGRWQQEGSNTVWTVEGSGGTMRTSFQAGDGRVREVACNTVGRECKLTNDGDDIAASMWFNGPKLVQLEIRGSDVIKRRFAVAPDGEGLEIEIIPIVPPGKTEVIKCRRVQPVTADR